jgi:deazaflavin-dependent oxidoreductase (nitroreductase family)
MGNWDWFGKLHRAVYEATGGRLGAKLGWLPMLLLTTIGRRSGEKRTVPLAYLEDGDAWVVVASNGGSDRHPAWWLNLLQSPRARIRVGRRELDVRASLATAEERARLWPRLKEVNPAYRGYETKTRREIPVVLLRRDGA